jgi:hypothetical protein
MSSPDGQVSEMAESGAAVASVCGQTASRRPPGGLSRRVKGAAEHARTSRARRAPLTQRDRAAPGRRDAERPPTLNSLLLGLWSHLRQSGKFSPFNSSRSLEYFRQNFIHQSDRFYRFFFRYRFNEVSMRHLISKVSDLVRRILDSGPNQVHFTQLVNLFNETPLGGSFFFGRCLNDRPSKLHCGTKRSHSDALMSL